MSRFQFIATLLLLAVSSMLVMTVVGVDAASVMVPAAKPSINKHLNLTQYEALPMTIKQQLLEVLPEDLGWSPWSWIKCEICKKIIGSAEDFVEKHGCAKFDTFAVSLCEMAGIGPEDPLADICAAALVAGCPAIAHEIEKHITSADTVCKDIHMC